MSFNKVDNKNSELIYKALKRQSTIQLIKRIVEDSDTLSLRVLLETRKLFRLRNHLPLLLPEFLLRLRDRIAPPDKYDKDKCYFADCTYDLTLAKYSNIPVQANKTLGSDDYSSPATMIDCRKYYLAVLHRIQRKIDKGKIRTQAQQESYVGKIFQSLVYINFLRSKLECRRRTPFSVRYAWNVNGNTFYLRYPSHITAKKFRKWLKKNIKEINPKDSKEQDRIQALIDKNLKRGYHISIDNHDNLNNYGINVKEIQQTSIELKEGHTFVNRLANAVAQQKVANISCLRPSVKKLGRNVIERMILQIFTDLSEGDYRATQIAAKYGISKPTFSRFAGSRWFVQTGDKKSIKIPDLWRNTAKILAKTPEFMETALSSGVAGKLEEILDLIESQKDQSNGR